MQRRRTWTAMAGEVGPGVASLVLLVSLLTAAPTPAAQAAARASSPPPGCGTWLLQEVSSTEALTRQATAIKRALRKDGVAGLSLRVPWTAIDRNFKVLNRAQKMAESRDKKLSVRFVAGRSTPARVFKEGAHYYRSGGDKIPKPFSNSGKPGNPVFQSNYRDVVTKLANWSRNNGVKLLHLPWYGYRWAEIYNGSAVKATKGYSYRAWRRGHFKLLKIGLRRSGHGLTVEFPLSGDWGGNSKAAGAIADRIVESTDEWSRRVLVQGNGLGRWNAPATNRPIFHAKQMVDGGDFDWSSIYQTLRSNDESYVEVYLSSFSGDRKRGLALQSKKFKAQRC